MAVHNWLFYQAFTLCLLDKSTFAYSNQSIKEFPLKEFFVQDNKEFLREYTSRYMCGESKTPGWQCCSCEPTCQVYGNCCVDYLWQRHNGNFSNMDDYKDFLIEEGKAKKNTRMECNYMSLSAGDNRYMNKPYIMIDKCPGNRLSCRKGTVENTLSVVGEASFLSLCFYF